MKYLKPLVLLFAVLIGSVFLARNTGMTLGATILTTNSSDTLSTFRTNVNTSLTNLNAGLLTAGQVGTSSVPTQGQLAYWTGIGTPSTLGSVATTSISCTAPMNCTSFVALGSASAISLSVAKGNFVVGSDAGVAQATSTVFISSIGLLGVATGTPFGLFSVNPAATLGSAPVFNIGSSTKQLLSINQFGQIQSLATQPATTTTITLDWGKTPQQVEYQIGTAATTITLINATTSNNWGSRKIVWVCNPAGTAGALTWQGAEWVGTAPVQSTNASYCDVYSFDVTRATSTTAFKVSGTAGTGFQ